MFQSYYKLISIIARNVYASPALGFYVLWNKKNIKDASSLYEFLDSLKSNSIVRNILSHEEMMCSIDGLLRILQVINSHQDPHIFYGLKDELQQRWKAIKGVPVALEKISQGKEVAQSLDILKNQLRDRNHASDLTENERHILSVIFSETVDEEALIRSLREVSLFQYGLSSLKTAYRHRTGLSYETHLNLLLQDQTEHQPWFKSFQNILRLFFFDSTSDFSFNLFHFISDLSELVDIDRLELPTEITSLIKDIQICAKDYCPINVHTLKQAGIDVSVTRQPNGAIRWMYKSDGVRGSIQDLITQLPTKTQRTWIERLKANQVLGTRLVHYFDRNMLIQCGYTPDTLKKQYSELHVFKQLARLTWYFSDQLKDTELKNCIRYLSEEVFYSIESIEKSIQSTKIIIDYMENSLTIGLSLYFILILASVITASLGFHTMPLVIFIAFLTTSIINATYKYTHTHYTNHEFKNTLFLLENDIEGALKKLLGHNFDKKAPFDSGVILSKVSSTVVNTQENALRLFNALLFATFSGLIYMSIMLCLHLTGLPLLTNILISSLITCSTLITYTTIKHRWSSSPIVEAHSPAFTEDDETNPFDADMDSFDLSPQEDESTHQQKVPFYKQAVSSLIPSTTSLLGLIDKVRTADTGDLSESLARYCDTLDPNEYDRTIFLLNVMQSFWIMNTATNTDQLHELWKAYRGIVKDPQILELVTLIADSTRNKSIENALSQVSLRIIKYTLDALTDLNNPSTEINNISNQFSEYFHLELQTDNLKAFLSSEIQPGRNFTSLLLDQIDNWVKDNESQRKLKEIIDRLKNRMNRNLDLWLDCIIETLSFLKSNIASKHKDGDLEARLLHTLSLLKMVHLMKSESERYYSIYKQDIIKNIINYIIPILQLVMFVGFCFIGFLVPLPPETSLGLCILAANFCVLLSYFSKWVSHLIDRFDQSKTHQILDSLDQSLKGHSHNAYFITRLVLSKGIQAEEITEGVKKQYRLFKFIFCFVVASLTTGVLIINGVTNLFAFTPLILLACPMISDIVLQFKWAQENKVIDPIPPIHNNADQRLFSSAIEHLSETTFVSSSATI